MEADHTFGSWIRRRRRALDLTQEALAQCLGCSVAWLRKIESGEGRASKQSAARLAECLAIPPEERGIFLAAARGEPGAPLAPDNFAGPAASSDPGAVARPLRPAAAPASPTPYVDELVWLAQTKLVAPSLPRDLIPRNTLLGWLRAAVLGHALTLLSAPPGYGKTTCLAALCRTAPQLPVAWLSLEQEDDGPARFLLALIGAFRSLNPDCGVAARALLAGQPGAGTESNLRRVMGVLVNDILSTLGEPFLLVLDDLHLLKSPAIYAALDYLLERLPPQMHLVAATRHDPPLALARLRARGRLAELRLDDLRFSPQEAAVFLNGGLRAGLSQPDMAALQERTEGWPAGLRLLAASLDQRAAPAGRRALIQGLAHTERHIFAFLSDEVVAGLEPEIGQFLLETSLLGELSPALCAAVTGRSDAGSLLEEVYRRNLFLTAVEQRGQINFHYHALFADFLRRRLEEEMPDRVAELHERAARAYSASAPERAVGHYLAAGCWDAAADVIERIGDDIVRQGLLETLRSWIGALPAEVLDRRPRLVYFLGVCERQRGRLEEAETLLERALAAFEARGDEAGEGLALLELANAAGGRHDYARQPGLIRRALEHPLPPQGRVQLRIIMAWQAMHQGRWSEVDSAVAEAIEVALASGDPAAFNVLGLQLQPSFAMLPHGPARLESYAQAALARFEGQAGPVTAGAHSLLGAVYLLRGQAAQAQAEIEAARAISERLGGFQFIDNNLPGLLVASYIERGDQAAASQAWAAVLPHFERHAGAQPWLPAWLYAGARIAWWQGRIAETRRLCERVATLPAGPRELSEVQLCRLLSAALGAICEQRFVVAERICREALKLQEVYPHTHMLGSARAMLARLYLAWNRPREALTELLPLLALASALAAPGLVMFDGPDLAPLLRDIASGAPRAGAAVDPGLVACAGEIIRLFETNMAGGAAQPLAGMAIGESLTPRELEVLRLLAQGASNRAIAEELVITERTAKAHVTNILAKLHVTSRAQAAVYARRLGL